MKWAVPLGLWMASSPGINNHHVVIDAYTTSLSSYPCQPFGMVSRSSASSSSRSCTSRRSWGQTYHQAPVGRSSIIRDGCATQQFRSSFVVRTRLQSTVIAMGDTILAFGRSVDAKMKKFSGSGSASSMSMFMEVSGGMEELSTLAEQTGGALDKQVRKSPTLFKIAGMASIPLSAALGFGLVPSRRLAAHTVGAVLSAMAGVVGKSRLDALTEANAKPAIATAIVEHGLDDDKLNETLTALQIIQDTFGITPEDYTALCTEIYATYLIGMVKHNPIAKTKELKELENLKTVLQLDNLQMGEAHATAAAEWYRTTIQFTPEEELDDPSHPDRQAMDKLLFLTERALRQSGETDQAFIFEMTRVAKQVGLDLNTALDRVAAIVEPFYQRALKSTRAKLGSQQVSSTMLERARRTLGVSDEVAADMHVAAFNAEVRNLLGLPERNLSVDEDVDEGRSDEPMIDLATAKFPDSAWDRLEELREILGLSETDADYEITLEATPLYQKTALEAMQKVLSQDMTADEAWETMDERREELYLPEESSKVLISSMVMQALGQPLEKTNKFAKVNNEAATYDNLLEALEAKQTLISILAKSGWDEFDNFDENFCNPWDKQSANGFLSTDERVKLYRMFLTRSIRKSESGALTDEMYDRIMQVKGLLGISDQQAEIQARAVFGPELQKVLNTATTEIVEDYTPELAENMKKRVNTVMENYRLTMDFLREFGASFYSRAVELISAKAPAGVPSEELAAALESLRELFHLTKEDTYPAHMEYFGKVYKKSVLEAMGTTGVIRPEFREPLEKLQARLGVSEESCKQLFLEAVKEKMIPMVEWIGTEMERTMLTQQQRSQRKGKDLGEDLFQTGKGATGVLGLGAEVNIMSDIMNLVDFYTENDIIEEKETGTRNVEKQIEVDGEKKSVLERESIREKVYPVTALGTGSLDDQMAELLFRQLVVSGFTTQGAQGARYEAARDTFAGILGLSKDKQNEILGNIANTVYDNLVTNAMKTKGAMDQQDYMFIANVQSKLGLSNEKSEKMLLEAQKKVLSEEINAITDNPSPAALKAFREKCNSMGMDLAEDVGISKQRLVRMFEAEVVPGLKSGEINADNSDVLTEIQESLGVDPDEAESMFETTLMRLAKNAMDLISSELLRGRVDNTVDLIKEIVRYAAFTEGDLGLVVEEATANEIVNIFETLDFVGEEKEVVESNMELLRLALGLES